MKEIASIFNATDRLHAKLDHFRAFQGKFAILEMLVGKKHPQLIDIPASQCTTILVVKENCSVVI